MSDSSPDPRTEADAASPLGEEAQSSGPSAGNASGPDSPPPLDDSGPPPPEGAGGGADTSDGEPGPEPSVVDVLGEVEKERDYFKDLALRTQAELENFRKQTLKRQTEALSRAAEGLVEELLPVLDAFDAARSHAPESSEVEALWSALWTVLSKQGLERIDAPDEVFDPNRHEAVSTLPADEGQDEGTVATVMRSGYVFKGRVLRAAMVAVRG